MMDPHDEKQPSNGLDVPHTHKVDLSKAALENWDSGKVVPPPPPPYSPNDLEGAPPIASESKKKKKKRRRLIALMVLILVLVAIIVGAVVGVVVHRMDSARDESGDGMGKGGLVVPPPMSVMFPNWTVPPPPMFPTVTISFPTGTVGMPFSPTMMETTVATVHPMPATSM